MPGPWESCFDPLPGNRLIPDTVTSDDLRAARELARTKFASSEWTARVPWRHGPRSRNRQR